MLFWVLGFFYCLLLFLFGLEVFCFFGGRWWSVSECFLLSEIFGKGFLVSTALFTVPRAKEHMVTFD